MSQECESPARGGAGVGGQGSCSAGQARNLTINPGGTLQATCIALAAKIALQDNVIKARASVPVNTTPHELTGGNRSKGFNLCVGHVGSVCVGAAVPGDTNSMLCAGSGVYYFFSISVK